LSTKHLTVSQLQDNNAKLKDKIDLIDMRLEEQEQYSRRTSLRFHNVRVPTDHQGNIIQPVDTDGIVLNICNKDLNVPLDIHHIGRSRPIGEAKDGKISIVFFYYSILSAFDWFLIILTLEFSLSFTSMEPSCVQKE
jgi:hypothetical protein